MKSRILSSIVALAILAAVVYLGREAVGIAVFILSLIGMYEFTGAAAKGGCSPIKPLAYLSCLPLLYIALADYRSGPGDSFGAENMAVLVFFLIFAVMISLFCIFIFGNKKYNLVDISVTLFGIFYIVFLISFVTFTRNLENGYLYIWFIFIGAWATDTFAYFTGVSVGRTKILPAVSPKKSLEGSIGGILGCVGAMTVFGLYAGGMAGGIPLYHFVAVGIICGIISQLGDWAASAVKRFVNIKDFGNIMPGHGGVLDRVDSILFTAPAVYFYIKFFIQG